MQINKNNIRFICISHNLIVSLTVSKILTLENTNKNKKHFFLFGILLT